MSEFDIIRNVIIDYDEGVIPDERVAFEMIRRVCFGKTKDVYYFDAYLEESLKDSEFAKEFYSPDPDFIRAIDAYKRKHRTLTEIIGDWKAPEDYELCEFMEKARTHRQFHITITEDPDEGGYVVSCEELPGCLTCGETIPEAIDYFRDAMKAWLAVAMEDGYEIQIKKTGEENVR